MQNDRPPPWPQDQLVEPAAEPVVEVVAVFDETILCARHLREGESFVIGVEPGVDATIAEGLLPIGTLPLVRARGRCHELLIVDELAGTIQLGEKSRSCASLIRSLDALPCPGIAAAHALPLHGGIRACFIVGALTFYVRHTTAARSLPKPRFSCEPTLVTALCSFAILCAWMLILAFAVPSDPALDRGHLAIDTLLRARVENLLARLDRQQAHPALSWDLRCTSDQWKKWMTDPPGMMKLGMAFTTGKIKFKVGDYGAMLKDPRMAGPFIKSFTVMGRA